MRCKYINISKYQVSCHQANVLLELTVKTVAFSNTNFCIHCTQVMQQNGIDISMSQAMLITLLPAMLPSLMTNLKYISPVSMLANVALLFGLIATLVIAFSDGPMPSISERDYFTGGSQLALFFGTALFSYEGIALILPLRNSMREPEKFTNRFGVLNVTMFFITALFIFTGFVSYMRWGDEVAGSITLNLEVEEV